MLLLDQRETLGAPVVPAVDHCVDNGLEGALKGVQLQLPWAVKDDIGVACSRCSCVSCRPEGQASLS